MKITLELTEKQFEILCMATERYKYVIDGRITNKYVTERQRTSLMHSYNDLVEIRYQLYNQDGAEQ